MQGAYDADLVALSIVTAVIASFVALDMASRVVAAAGHATRAAWWLICGAVSMGTGIWAMHFVGMLAFSLPTALAYDIPVTLLSWWTAVLSSTLALHTISRSHLGWGRMLAAGSLMGLGIASMHYLGMAALKMHPGIRYDPALFALSVLLAVAASTAALQICFRLRHETIVTSPGKKAAGALVMGAAIVGMHYTGMAAADFPAGSVCGARWTGIGGAGLGLTVAALAAVFLLTTLLSSVYGAIPPTIRSRLVFLVIVALTPSALLTLALVIMDFGRLTDMRASDQLNTTRAVVAALDRDLNGIESGLRVLSGSQLLQADRLAAFYQEARDALPHLRASALILEDDRGRPLLDTRRPPPGPSGELEALGPALAPASGDPLLGRTFEVAVALPMDKQVAVLGARVLRAHLSAERLQELLSQQQMDGEWIATIYDDRGLVRARSRDVVRFFGKPGPAALMTRMEQKEEGLLDLVSLDGTQLQYGYVRSQITAWSVGIGVPRDSLRQPLLQSLAWLLAGLLVTVAASLLLAWRIGGRIAAAVEALTGPALALGTGVAIEVPARGVVEVDRVGRALQDASRLLDAAQHKANHDPLTGLANRNLFRQLVQQQLVLARRSGSGLAVMYVDLDGFKGVNDTHGHGVGDLLLQEAAQRLQSTVRAGDVVARLGGDEFAMALVNPGPSGSAQVAAKLVQRMAEPFLLNGLRISISASVGAATVQAPSGDQPSDCDTLLARADAAMYQAKQAGKSRFVLAKG